MKKLQQVVDRYIEKGIPYIDVIAHRDHREIMRYANAHAPVTGKEQLYMYSCTKPMTMAAVMRLVEDGRLSIDTPVGDILPAYRDVYVEDNGVRHAPATVLTVRHLMTMTGGLSYDFSHYPIEACIRDAGGQTMTRAIADGFARAPLYFNPGSKYQYSLCHDVLGAVIEQVSGKSFGAYMQDEIWGQLGMTHTRFGKPSEDGVADQYIVENGKVKSMSKACTFVFTDGYESGGAGTVSCVEDYAKLAAMYACGGVGADGRRILTEQSIRTLTTPQVDHTLGFTCTQGDQTQYAYGLGMRVRLQATPYGIGVGEFGWDGAAGSFLLADPKNRISVAIGMHLFCWGLLYSDVHMDIIRAVYEDMNEI